MTSSVSMLWLLLCTYGTGLLLGPGRLPWPLPAVLLLAALLRRRPRIALASAAVLAGLLRVPETAPAPCPLRQARVVGRVVEGPEPIGLDSLDGGRFWFTLEVDRARLLVRVATGNPGIRPGDRVEVEGRPRPLEPPTNPGQADYRPALTRRGIVATLDVGPAACCRLLRPGPWWWPWRLAHGLRRYALQRIASALPPGSADLTAALVLGLKSGLEPALRDRFRSTGCYHLLAVSGLHLGLILAGTHRILRSLGLGGRGRGVLMLLSSLLYMGIAGFSPSIVRAGTMGALYALAEIGRRSVRAVDIVPAAALLVLTIDPSQALSLGFQLSLTAMAGIVFGYPALRRIAGRRPILPPSVGIGTATWQGIKRGFAVSLGACLFTAPLSAYAFARFVPWSPLVSIVMVPWLALFLTVALPVAFIPMIPLAPAVDLLSRLGIETLTLVDRLPLTPLVVPPISRGTLLCAEGALLFLVRWRPRTALVLALAAIGLSGATPSGVPAEGAARVLILDVGHGLACTLEAGGGPTILIDAGSSGIRDVGRRVIEPALLQSGIERIDLLVLTHLDADHTSGVTGLTSSMPIARCLVPSRSDPRPAARAALRALLAAGVPVTVAPPGTLRISLPGLTLRVIRLNPPRASAGNTDSLVLLMEGPWGRVLVPGDQEARALLGWIAAERTPPVDLLVLPHHGRRQPGLGSLIEHLRPTLVVASCGRVGPDPGLARGQDAVLVTTREEGAISVHFAPARLSWCGWRAGHTIPSSDADPWSLATRSPAARSLPPTIVGLALPAVSSSHASRDGITEAR